MCSTVKLLADEAAKIYHQQPRNCRNIRAAINQVLYGIHLSPGEYHEIYGAVARMLGSRGGKVAAARGSTRHGLAKGVSASPSSS